MPGQNDFPKWDAAKPDESLLHIQQWAVTQARERIDWYKVKSKGKKRWSVALRVMVISAAALGGLCPLIEATGVFGASAPGATEINLGRWGYVLIALAAATAGFDKYFGLSTGWMRFIVTQLSLERSLQEFQYDCALLHTQRQEQQTGTSLPLLQRAKDFSMQVEDLTRQETDAWVQEFQSSLAELEKVLKTEVEARRVGSIKVVIANASQYDKVAILLNRGLVKELVGISEGLIEAIPPRRYELTAVGTKGGREYTESKVIEVQPNAMVSVDITLPAPPASPAGAHP